MSINRSIILSGLALAVAVPMALASSAKDAPIVNPALPDNCIPPGLVKGQPKPANWTPPTTWRPPMECFRMPLFVRPPEVEDDDDDRPTQSPTQQPQQGQQPQQPQQGQSQPGRPQQADDSPSQRPDRGGDGAQTEAGTEQADAPDVRPQFKPGFFRRTWQVQASVFAIDTSGATLRLDVDVERMFGVPRGLRTEAKSLVEYGAYVLLSPKVKVTIFNPELEERFPGTVEDIQSDDQLRIRGRFLAPSKWLEDQGGDKVATMRASGVVIIDDEYEPDVVDPAE